MSTTVLVADDAEPVAYSPAWLDLAAAWCAERDASTDPPAGQPATSVVGIPRTARPGPTLLDP